SLNYRLLLHFVAAHVAYPYTQGCLLETRPKEQFVALSHRHGLCSRSWARLTGVVRNCAPVYRLSHSMTLKVSGIVAAFSAGRSGQGFGSGVMPVPSLGWVVIIWGFTLGYVFALVGALPARMKEWDFGLYYASALSLRLGHNPYREPFTALADRL